jgi:hypothetical protein
MHSQIVDVPERGSPRSGAAARSLASAADRAGARVTQGREAVLRADRVVRYSVPMALIGTSVEVPSSNGRVLIVNTKTG